jgi:hypothetical protein
MRKLTKYRAKVYEPVPEVEARFQVGETVHFLDDGTCAVISAVRRDGWCCLALPSGAKEWQPQSALCGPLVR